MGFFGSRTSIDTRLAELTERLKVVQVEFQDVQNKKLECEKETQKLRDESAVLQKAIEAKQQLILDIDLNAQREYEAKSQACHERLADLASQEASARSVLLDLRGLIKEANEELKKLVNGIEKQRAELTSVIELTRIRKEELSHFTKQTREAAASLVTTQKQVNEAENRLHGLQEEHAKYDTRKEDLDIYARRIQKYYEEAGLGNIKI